jgi:hypothetical protein
VDEAVLPNGLHIAGKVIEGGPGALRFSPATGAASFPVDQAEHVRFAARSLPPFRIAAAYRVTLQGEQHLTGELLGLDEKALRFRTAWAEPLTIPRAAVVAAAHAPGFATIFQDHFEAGLKDWKLTGTPEGTADPHFSGRSSLRLASQGQSAEYRLATALRSGKIGVNFREGEKPGGARWLVEAEFEGKAEPGRVRMTIGDAGGYHAEILGKVGRIPCSPGWHRLTVEFTPRKLVLAVDDEGLQVDRQPNVGGALRKLRLACVAAPGSEALMGGVFFTAFSLARAMPVLPRPQGDPTQDELWLLAGDQLFGSVPRLDSRSIDLRARFGFRSVGWSEVRGVYLRQPDARLRPVTGRSVSVWLRSGCSLDADRLDGTLLTFDEHRLGLKHAVLGELKIERSRLQRLRQWPAQ